MPNEIYLIKVGMSMTEGIVEEWYIPDGGTVEVGELLYRLETEKINLDVDAEVTGIVRHAVAEGITMEPGAVVGYIYAAGEEIPDALPGTADVAAKAASLEAVASQSTSPVGSGAATTPATSADGAAPADTDARRSSSPNARRLARELNIDLAAVNGTGPGGRITREDVVAAAESAASPAPAAAAGGGLPGTGAAQVLPLRGREAPPESVELLLPRPRRGRGLRLGDGLHLRSLGLRLLGPGRGYGRQDEQETENRSHDSFHRTPSSL